MQINRNMSAVVTNNQLLRIENKLSASMQRLSSGLKLNRASDNPAGMAISNKMKAQIDALDNAESNASDAISVLQIADGALNEIASVLQRMNELAVQAANGTNAYSDRQSIQDEIDELKKEVDRISTATEYNTKKLIDGSSDVRIYAENASRLSATDTVAAQKYTLNVAEPASKATVRLDYESPTKDGRITINGVVVEVTDGMGKESYLHEIRKAAEEAGCTAEIDEENQQILIKSNFYGYDESIEFTMSKALAEDIELGRDNTDSAYVITETEYTFPKYDDYPENPDDARKRVGQIAIDGVVVNLANLKNEDEYVAAMKKAAIDAGYTADVNANGITVKSDSLEAQMIDFSFSYNLAEEFDVINNYHGDYTVNTQGTDAVVEIPGGAASEDDITAREAAGFTTTATVNTEGNRVEVTDNLGFSISFLLDENYDDNNTYDPDNKTGNFEIEVTEIGSLTIQVGANENQDMDLRIEEVSVNSLYIDTVDVAVVKGPERSMTVIDKAIAHLSSIRSRIGAFQNRLEYASTSLAATEENMTAAYSGILDTDMAEEMAEYTQQNVLNQAAVSVLAQANELPQQVLSLLK